MVGTLKDAVNKPVLVDATVATVNESKVMVTVELGLNPVPETVTTEFTAPEVGLRVMPGMTVKTAEAETEKASVAATVCAPFVDTGTVRVVVNAPVPPVFAVPILIASNDIVTVEDAEYPDPVTVNEEPD